MLKRVNGMVKDDARQVLQKFHVINNSGAITRVCEDKSSPEIMQKILKINKLQNKVKNPS